MRELVQKTEEVLQEDGSFKSEGVWEFDSAGANRALELLGKHLKLFTDRLQIGADDELAKRLEAARRRTPDGMQEEKQEGET